MSGRTQIGIIEWARRIEWARVTEMLLAEKLGAAVAEVPDATAKVALVRQARLHAWHAELWMNIAPVLHGFSADEVASVAHPRAGGASTESLVEQLDNGYQAWQADASRVADAPILRVLHLVMRDHEDVGGA